MLIVRSQCRTKRPASITGGRLHPDVFELSVPQNFTIGNVVQCNATGEAKIRDLICLGKVARDAQHNLFSNSLNRRRKIHFALLQQLFRLAWRRTKKIVELLGRHCQAGHIIEVALIQPEASVRLQIHDVFKDEVFVLWLSVRRQSHDLVFTRVHLEPGVVGKG